MIGSLSRFWTHGTQKFTNIEKLQLKLNMQPLFRGFKCDFKKNYDESQMFWIIWQLWLIGNVPKQNYTHRVYELNLYQYLLRRETKKNHAKKL